MCDPVTLTLIAAGISATAVLAQGSAAEASGEYNAQIAEQNAELSEQQAAEAERRFRISSRRQLGSMRAAYSASGVILEGSPLDILEESAYTAELDALTIREGGRTQAAAFEAEARLAQLEGRQAVRTSQLSAFAELTGGGARAFSMRAT